MECQLLPDAETLEIQLRNMYDHLQRLVRKAWGADNGDTDYAVRERETRPFLHRRPSSEDESQ